jgi:hypothetical protein
VNVSKDITIQTILIYVKVVKIKIKKKMIVKFNIFILLKFYKKNIWINLNKYISAIV